MVGKRALNSTSGPQWNIFPSQRKYLGEFHEASLEMDLDGNTKRKKRGSLSFPDLKDRCRFNATAITIPLSSQLVLVLSCGLVMNFNQSLLVEVSFYFYINDRG